MWHFTFPTIDNAIEWCVCELICVCVIRFADCWYGALVYTVQSIHLNIDHMYAIRCTIIRNLLSSFLPSFHPYLECLTRAQPLTLYFSSSSSSSFSAYKFLVSDYNDVVSHIRFAIHFIFWNFLIHLIFRFWLGVMLCTAPQYSWHDGRGERNSSTSRDSSIKFCREKIPFGCGTRWRRRNQKVKHRQCSRAHSCMGLHARA